MAAPPTAPTAVPTPGIAEPRVPPTKAPVMASPSRLMPFAPRREPSLIAATPPTPAAKSSPLRHPASLVAFSPTAVETPLIAVDSFGMTSAAIPASMPTFLIGSGRLLKKVSASRPAPPSVLSVGRRVVPICSPRSATSLPTCRMSSAWSVSFTSPAVPLSASSPIAGRTPFMIVSPKVPRACFASSILPSVVLANASPDPPNSLVSSAKISFCACIVLPDSTSTLIWSVWDSVNETPTFFSAVTPLIGSFSAFPSWVMLAVGIARCMSTNAVTVWSKMSLPLPTALRTLVNVSSRFAFSWIVSASVAVRSSRRPVRSWMCFAETPATPPVDLIAAWVCLLIRSMRASD